MNYVTKFLLALGLILPSFAFSMDFSKITERRKLYSPDSEDENDNDSENDSSLNNSIISKKDNEASALDQKEQQNKAVATENAGTASSALAKQIDAISRKASEGKFTPKTVHYSGYDQTRVTHSNSDIKLDDVKNEEWGDGTESNPEVPPFDEYASENKNIDLELVAPANTNVHMNNNNEEEIPPIVPPRDIEDEQPTIEEMPDPDAPPLPDYSDDEDDQPNSHLPQQPGVKEERNTTQRPLPRFIPSTRQPNSQQSERPSLRQNRDLRNNNSVRDRVTQFENNGIAQRRPNVPSYLPARTPVETETLQGPASDWNITPLLISAGLFGVLTYAHQTLASHQKMGKNKIAREFVHGAQQAAAANVAQQMLPGKPANSAAFTALFSVLHACEFGLKKAAESVFAKTKIGKNIAMKFRKMPKRKQSTLKNSCMAASWLFKTLIARALTA